MGAYLTAPVTDKESSDGTCIRLSYGASSMQGWRRTQEDAHNCIVEFEKDASLFAVYDGHGGAEVAKYCSIHLPDFILSRPEYKNGNIVQALEDAFLEFDATLIKPEVISELKQIAGLSEASESDDNAEKLRLEARMPLEDLLSRYRGLHAKVAPHLHDFHNENPKSPMLRAKTDAKMKISSSVPDDGTTEITEDDSCNNAEASAEEEGGPCDSVRSSTNNRIVNGKEDDENDSDKQNTCDSTTDDLNLPIKKTGKFSQESIVSDTSEVEVGDSESAKPKDNGAISSSDNKITSVCDSEVPESSACDTSDSVANTSQANSSCYVEEEDANGADSSTRKCIRMMLYADSSESSEDEDYGLSESGEGTDEEEDDSGDKGEEDEEEEDDDDDDDEDYERAEVEICDKEEPGSESGCTAVVAVLKGDMLYVANAGDSRCVVSRQGQAVDMSIDHKPEDRLEKTRIEEAGGEVTLDGRVNGGLNLSRAIGDHAYKQNGDLGPKEQMITSLPDVKTVRLDLSQDEFMVLACDGIWNHMSSQEVVDFIQKRITKENVKLSSLCEELFDNCLAPSTDGDGTGCDNMTCIIVKFHNLMALPSKKRNFPSSDDEDDQLSGSSKKRKECTENKTT